MAGISASAISTFQGHSAVIGRYLDPTISLLSIVFQSMNCVILS